MFQFHCQTIQIEDMNVEEELAASSPEKDMALTIGVFDGVHLGHKYLLSQLKEHARQKGLLSGVVTFNTHPANVLSPGTRQLFLTDRDTRIRLLQDEGVDSVITLSFTNELAQLSARQFASTLKKCLKMRSLLIGSDFALGRKREGDIDTLRTLGKELNFSVILTSPLKTDDEIISSTNIRSALANGDMERVTGLTGRPFSLHGRVGSGAGRGKKLGFPTANLDVDPQQALPPDGVYATRAYIDDKAYKSLTNIGKNPTFGGSERTIEVYIIDYQGSLQGKELRIDIIKRLREEKQFDTAQQLVEQMKEDVRLGKVILDY